MKDNIKSDSLLKVEDAAIFLNFPISRVRNLVFKKEMPFLKIGRSIRFRKKDIEKYLEGLEVKPLSFY